MKIKKKHQVDERIKLERQKIGNETCIFVLLMLLISAFVQQQIFKAPLSQYIVELAILLIASVYIIFRNIFSGNVNNKKPLIFVNCLVVSISATSLFVIQYIINGTVSERGLGSDILSFVVMFAVAMLGSLGAGLTFFFLNKKRTQKIEKKLDEDENSD